MAHVYRFLAEKDAGGAWRLGEEEAHHLTKVLRLDVGAEIEVADGQGLWAEARVAEIKGKRVEVEVVREVRAAAPAWRLTVAVGALKPGVVDDLLPGLVELGVDRLVVFAQRGDSKGRVAPQAVERWERIVRNALKQCKRAWMPELVVHGSLDELVAAEAARPAARFVLAPGAARALWDAAAQLGGTDVLVVAGGEKGLDADEEARLVAAGCEPVAMGEAILRAVTATTAAAAVVAMRRAAVVS